MEKLYKVSIKSKHLILLFTLIFTTQFGFAQGQNTTVTGKVISSDDNMGIPDVLVTIKGTSNSTATDFDGNYSISVPQNSVLVFSSVGFLPQEVLVTESTVNISMQPDTKLLDEVVVIGYGTQKKEAVTGSVASISGDNLREMPAPNITQAMQSRLPGVEINQTDSRPGAAMQIRIRGVRSLTGSNNPLIVLDGIPFSGSITDINSDDIKSIDVLKDASATAVYGSRGSNGVILITTKKGAVGQEAQFSYNSYFGVRTAREYPMMSGPELVKLRAAANLYTNGPDEFDDVNTNWQDLYYKTGVTQNHHLNVTGGTAKGNYTFSTTYYKDEGVVPLQDYQRLSLFGALDQQIGDYIRVGVTTNSNYSVTDNGTGLYGVLSQSPLASPYDEDGNPRRAIETAADQSWVNTRSTLEALGDKYVNQNRAYASYNSAYAEVKVPGVEGLKYRLNLGGNLRVSFGGYYEGAGVFDFNEATVSNANINQSINTTWTAENILSYDRIFGEKHSVSALALYSAQQEKFNSSAFSTTNIASDAFQFYNLGRTDEPVVADPNNQGYYKRGLTSYMGRVTYSYDGRYMFNASYRSDGSSVLAPGNKWHSYPALSAGWNIANESFMSGVKSINQLKLRVGYGQTANQAINPYKTLGLLSSRPYNYSDVFLTGYYVSEAPSPDLGWEYTEGWNYAIDYGLFNNRLSGSIEYYVMKTSDVLVGVGLPGSSGLGSYTDNAANTQNKGIEFSANGLIIDNPNGFSLSAGFNIYANKNEITSLSNGTDRNEGQGWFVGHSINSIYDYKNIGLWQEGDPYLDILEPGGTVGMIKVEYTGEYNEDGTPVRAIGADDRQVLDVNPDFQGGFNTNMSYKGFDLNIVGGFQSGGILISTLYGSGGYLNLLNGRRGNVDVDYWTPENTDARYPNPAGPRSGDNPKYGSTLGYFDASYVKIRTITLGYNFTQDFIKKAGFERLRLYATLQNPWIISSPYHKETGLDPEPNSYGDQNQAVSGYNNRILVVGTNAPNTRNFVFGLNVTF
ncbi:SusC/RagA family TonB-linked outer membrane protein [Flavobacterium rhizosphaerae]|uniref:TonB-dependent receptor n=1 Tax=Flavobacterium rhizosphaerae TaxID=3163298 RepID=A0ABW8YW54_9FLAO